MDKSYRVNDCPPIQEISYYDECVRISSRSVTAYIVIDKFQIYHMNNRYMAVIVREVSSDAFMIPGVEPALCFPLPEYDVRVMIKVGKIIRSSILFFDDDFWIPTFHVKPTKIEILSYVYGKNSFIYNKIMNCKNNEYFFDIVQCVRLYDFGGY